MPQVRATRWRRRGQAMAKWRMRTSQGRRGVPWAPGQMVLGCAQAKTGPRQGPAQATPGHKPPSQTRAQARPGPKARHTLCAPSAKTPTRNQGAPTSVPSYFLSVVCETTIFLCSAVQQKRNTWWVSNSDVASGKQVFDQPLLAAVGPGFRLALADWLAGWSAGRPAGWLAGRAAG